jgi:dTMP kinase
LRAALEKRLTRDDGFVGFDWATLALLFAADRMDHVRCEIEPIVQQGHWVISDRYALSSRIYQTLTAPISERALDWVDALNSKARRPDLVIVLDVSGEVAEQRRSARGGPEELFDRRELQAKLAEAYLSSERYSDDEIVHVDGAQSIDEVARRVFVEIAKRFLRVCDSTSR